MAGTEAVHTDPEKEAVIRRCTPLARRARLDALVGPVVFLASDAACSVTATVLAVAHPATHSRNHTAPAPDRQGVALINLDYRGGTQEPVAVPVG